MVIGKFQIDEIYQGDCIELMKDIPDEVIDLVIADPPFGIEFEKVNSEYNRRQHLVLSGYKDVPAEKYYEFTLNWMKEVYRVLKETGSLYVFSGWTRLKDILIALDELGFTTINHIIWKYQFGCFTYKKFVTSHYHILFAVKNAKRYKFNKIEHYPEDVWIINREYWTGKWRTPTKLPKELVRKIILFQAMKEI